MIKSIQRKGRKDAKAAKFLYVIASKAKQSATCARDCYAAKLLAMTEQRMLSAASTFAFSASLRPLR
jgi:hypothetical protein